MEEVFPPVDPVLARGERLARVRHRMREVGVDALLLSLGADLPWLTGYEAMPLERITMLVLPADDDATLVVPLLEAPRVAHDARLFALRPWRESEDPIRLIEELVGPRREVAVSDRCLGEPSALPPRGARRPGIPPLERGDLAAPGGEGRWRGGRHKSCRSGGRPCRRGPPAG